MIFTFDLIGDIHGTHPDILVCGEAYVAVRHCLLGHAVPNSIPVPGKTVQVDTKFMNKLAVPKSDLSKIKKLYSHPQAWGQCKAFLSTYLKGIERQDVSSTSRAAELVAADPSGEAAALSSHVAADVFGLDVLAESINDHLGNTTRFLVIRRRESPASLTTYSPPTTYTSPASPSKAKSNEKEKEEDKQDGEEGAKYKTLITFTVDHAHPGALAKCLTIFSKYELNLTSINTRPSGRENWNYVFFVEVEGRREGGDEGHGKYSGEEKEGDGEGKGKGKMDRALEEVGEVARECVWKGSWRSAA